MSWVGSAVRGKANTSICRPSPATPLPPPRTLYLWWRHMKRVICMQSSSLVSDVFKCFLFPPSLCGASAITLHEILAIEVGLLAFYGSHLYNFRRVHSYTWAETHDGVSWRCGWGGGGREGVATGYTNF